MTNPVLRLRRIRGVGVKLALVAAVVALLGAGTARAADPVLTGDVGAGDAFIITLTDPSGSSIKHVDAGTYTVVLHDRSSFHNFHLSGPGVDVTTAVEEIGDRTFTVALTDGQYFFNCDPHSSQMKGTFTVGNFTAPTPTPKPTPTPAGKLTASIGPGAKFSLGPTGGVSAGKVVVTVNDRSTTDGFRLAGPGVAKSTSAKFRGTVKWTVTLKSGRYSFGSLKSAKLRKSFTVS
jgi:hypothetical protein